MVLPFLFSRFFPIMFLAKHLTVLGDCFAALMPRGNMVCFHFLKFKVFRRISDIYLFAFHMPPFFDFR